MIIGEDLIYACPHCGTYFKQMNVMSGNTFGATFYSDGKYYAPMMRDVPRFTSCRKCKHIIDIAQLKPVNPTHGFSWRKLLGLNKPIDAKNIPYCHDLRGTEWDEALQLFPAYEQYFRICIWQDAHDVCRQWPVSSDFEVYLKKNIEREDYKKNCRALLKLLDTPDKSIEDILGMAEIYRNLGEFEKAIETLELIRDKRLGNVHQDIMSGIIAACKQENKLTFRLKTEAEKKQEAEEKRKQREERIRKIHEAWLKEEEKDPRWKICPNGHCFQNIQSSCPWCEKSGVVGRLDADTPIFKQYLYVGKLNGDYVLTKDKDVPQQEERIRNICVEYNADYFFGFYLDGKNPNPRLGNTIRFADISIKGRELTLMCERMVRGEHDMITLSNSNAE